jgi:3-deoxy-D-manno-octulosonic-acid transferase
VRIRTGCGAMSTALPWPIHAYRLVLTLLSPVVPLFFRSRVREGKEDPDRLTERYGHPGRDRPKGDLVWAHGASIGETLSLIPIVERLVRRGLPVLVTSGTRTSAEIMARRLPPGALHQYLPLDAPPFIRRFLNHWRPHLVLFAESEVWPTIITELERRRIPLILVNGRLSLRSFKRWGKMPKIGRALMSRFALCLAQSDGDAERLAMVGAPVSGVAGNIKFDLEPPPAPPAAVEALSAELAGRTVWLAASTHPGEDELIVAAHQALKARLPRLLTIIAPRHPKRGEEIAALAEEAELDVNCRSRGGRAGAARDIHVADTVGELGLFYRVVPLVFMGGSLVPHGGQNPIEPARLGTAILHGPHVHNFDEVYPAFDADGGALEVENGEALAAALGDLLADAGLMRDMARAAATTVGTFTGALERTMAAIEPYLPPPSPDPSASRGERLH